MLTVKEFNGLDVEIVSGDRCELTGQEFVFGCDSIDEIFSDSIMVSFAWRPLNTLPDNPKFKYEIDTDIHSWRPLLDQSEVEVSEGKPVFTQAIEVGSEVVVSTINGIKEGVVIGVFKRWYWVDVVGVGLKTYDKVLVGKKDTPTPKQKAVDELMVEILDFYGYGDDDGYKSLSEHLNELGYERSARPTT